MNREGTDKDKYESGEDELADLQYRMAMQLRNDVVEDEALNRRGGDHVSRKEAKYKEDASVSYNNFV
eukprot:1800881-Ditylum_brightwellii.AAC.1